MNDDLDKGAPSMNGKPIRLKIAEVLPSYRGFNENEDRKLRIGLKRIQLKYKITGPQFSYERFSYGDPSGEIVS